MADRKVYIELKVKMLIRADDGTDISEVVQEMEYDFTDTTGNAQIEETEIMDYEVLDSK